MAIYEFASAAGGDRYFRPEPVLVPFANRFPSIKQDMTAKDVLTLVGSPDFVVDNGWEFDVAGASAATYVIEWENWRVSTTRKTEPKWKDGLTRDRHIVLF